MPGRPKKCSGGARDTNTPDAFADLKVTSNDMTQFPQNKRTPRLWGATHSEPTTVEQWRANFAAWCFALHWFLEHSERSELDAQRARKVAPFASLLHAPEPDGVSSATRAALWRVRGLLSSEPETARPLDFGDPHTLLLWLDFLGESGTRRAAWKRFEKQHGQRAAL